MAHHNEQLTRNHGVKDENLTRIFLPLGIEELDFDVSWLATITAFSAKRGVAAHGSWITYQIDPLTELNDANQILQGVQVFDAVISKALTEIC